MNDATDLREHASTAPARSVGVGLSIVIPVYRGAATIGRLVEALSALRPAGGLEIVLVNDGSPDNSGDVCTMLVQSSTVRAQFRRAQCGHDGIATSKRHLRDHHG